MEELSISEQINRKLAPPWSPYPSAIYEFLAEIKPKVAKLEAELKQLKEDCKPLQAQIDQRKTYKVTTPQQISGNF